MPAARVVPLLCGVCQERLAEAHGRCARCRRYLWRNGYDRRTEDIAAQHAQRRATVLV